MSKRVADTQITSDFPGENDDGDSPQFVKASSEVMAKRKILKPRGAVSHGLNGFNGFQSGGSKAFAFKSAGFCLNGSQSTSSDQLSNSGDDKNNRIKALNEKFIEAINKSNVPGTVVSLTALAKKYIEYYQQIDQGSSKPDEQIVTSVQAPKPFSFTTASASTPAVAPLKISSSAGVAAAKPETVEVDSDSDLEDEIKIEGPKFTLASKPTVKKSPFSFGPKPEKKKVDSDSSESEIEIKGPTFSFNKPIKDNVFKLAPTPNSTSFSFGKTDKVESQKPTVPEPKPAFSFGLPTTAVAPVTSSKSFTFSAQPSTSKELETKPSFNFSDTAPGTSTFNFDAPKPTSELANKSPIPLFNFGSSSNFSKESTEKPSASAGSNPFSFTQKSGEKAPPPTTLESSEKNQINDNGESKPLFSFHQPGESRSETKEPAKSFLFSSLNFGSTTTSNGEATPKPKPFSFETPEGEVKKNSEESLGGGKNPNPFTFGLGTNSGESSAPKAFSFTSNRAEEASNSVGFGSSSNFGTSSGFSFSSNNVPKDSPKAFSFTSNTSTKKSPALFSFNSNNAPKDVTETSSLAKSNAPSEATKLTFLTDSKGQAKGGLLSFRALSADSKTGTFGGFGTTTPDQKANHNDEEKLLVEEEETGGDFKPIAQLATEKVTSPSTGEEDEVKLFEKRAKLMLYDPENNEQPYANKGLGDLKVLKNAKTNKTRILVRADGGLRILLNTAVSKDFTYSTIGNGAMVRIPTINTATKNIETFVLKVKTPADGEELLKAIKGAKS